MNPPRHALSDIDFAAIEPLLPTNARPGHPWKSHRRVIDGILWNLSPARHGVTFPDPATAPGRPSTSGSAVGARTAPGVGCSKPCTSVSTSGKIDWDWFCVDGSSIRASRDAAGASPTDGTPAEPADHALGRSQGGFGSKIHLVCDGKGLPMAMTVIAGQRHEATQFEAVMGRVRVPGPKGRPRTRPRKVAGDKGYNSRQIRRSSRRRGIVSVIPTKANEKRIRGFDNASYRRRNVVGRCIGWIKDRQRLATRFEKLAENFEAMVKLAMLERLLKALLPDTAQKEP